MPGTTRRLRGGPRLPARQHASPWGREAHRVAPGAPGEGPAFQQRLPQPPSGRRGVDGWTGM
eukprot:4269332-Lingulodinium_polyedra.AAC.1